MSPSDPAIKFSSIVKKVNVKPYKNANACVNRASTNGKLPFLRSTKWNANLILLRDYAELVALCKVIVWKTHIPVRTQK